MNLDVGNWGYLPSELNEFRFAAIRTLDNHCLNPQQLCIQCAAHHKCGCTYIHDALSKCGIKPDTFMTLKSWTNTYYECNPRL